MSEKSCCFSGHRSVSIYDKEVTALLVSCVNKKIGEGYNNFYVGGSVGFDMLCAIVLADLKRHGANIKIHFALPCYNYTTKWNEKQKALQKILLEYADTVTMVSTGYDLSCMYKRNRYMVDRSDLCICYLHNNKGGTAYTVEYAKKKGLEIINLS